MIACRAALQTAATHGAPASRSCHGSLAADCSSVPAGSLLDYLLSEAVGEAPAVQPSAGLPAEASQPATSPVPAAPGTQPSPAVQLVCPGAPRRSSNLLAPPEVPSEVLAALRPTSSCSLDRPSQSSSIAGDSTLPALKGAYDWLSGARAASCSPAGSKLQ